MQVLVAHEVVADGDCQGHLAANVRTEHAEEGGFFVFELEGDVLDGTGVQRHFSDEGVDAVHNVEVAREVRFGRCGFLLLHRIQFFWRLDCLVRRSSTAFSMLAGALSKDLMACSAVRSEFMA